MRKRKNRGIEELKSRYGKMFVLHWVIGVLLFFAYPLIQSIIYSFSTVVIVPGGVEREWVGIQNYRNLLMVDSGYTNSLRYDLTQFLYSLPIILLLSLVLAIVLNQNFRGRLFFRALYFLPVIIATGTVINLIFDVQGGETQSFDRGASEALSANMLSADDILNWLALPTELGNWLIGVIAKVFDLVWSCGIQIVLFLAGLQSIPSSLYEASKVEGANKWEEFWFITFPMLSNVTLLVGMFTMIELITNERGSMVKWTYKHIRSGIYDTPSAMLWMYFLVSGILMGLIIYVFNRMCIKKWEA